MAAEQLFTGLIVRWLETAIVNFPVIVVLIVALWDMRKALARCEQREAEMKQKLLNEVLARDM